MRASANVFCLVLLAITLTSCGSRDGAETNGSERTATKLVPTPPLPQSDQCSGEIVQLAVLNTARWEFGTLLRGALGDQYWQPSRRDDANADAIKNLGLVGNVLNPANGYERWEYFTLDSASIKQTNKDTGAVQCAFVVRVFGSKARERSVSVIVGSDELTAKKMSFLLPEDDITLTGVGILNKPALEGYAKDGYLLTDGSLGVQSLIFAFKKFRWTSVTLGRLGVVEIGDDIAPAVGRPENAARWLFEAPISRQWSRYYRFEGRDAGTGSSVASDAPAQSEASEGEPSVDELVQQCVRQKILEAQEAGIDLGETIEDECRKTMS
jgi:hypothetical protein